MSLRVRTYVRTTVVPRRRDALIAGGLLSAAVPQAGLSPGLSRAAMLWGHRADIADLITAPHVSSSMLGHAELSAFG